MRISAQDCRTVCSAVFVPYLTVALTIKESSRQEPYLILECLQVESRGINFLYLAASGYKQHTCIPLPWDASLARRRQELVDLKHLGTESYSLHCAPLLTGSPFDSSIFLPYYQDLGRYGTRFDRHVILLLAFLPCLLMIQLKSPPHIMGFFRPSSSSRSFKATFHWCLTSRF